MRFALVVVRAFGPHARGDVIDDAAAMGAVLRCDQAVNVVRVALPMTGTDVKEG